MATDTDTTTNGRSIREPLPRILLVEDEALQATMPRMLLLDRVCW